MRSKISFVITGLVLIALTACSSVPPVNDLPAYIARASTPADHSRIADYFAQKSVSYENEAALHEKMALSYAGRPKGDLSTMQAHCRLLQEQFVNAAKEARVIEQLHRQLARETNQ